MELTQVWPLRGLVIRLAALELRPMTEADLPELLEQLPDDLEMDPRLPRYAAYDDRANRAVALVQEYWRHLGGWSAHDWALPLVVRVDGVAAGVQTLEGPADYVAQRVVDSASWLGTGWRGRGIGRLMRAGALELAFRHLGAVAAVSSAALDNGASLGVSRSLGYHETHRSVLEHDGSTLQHLRLARADWAARQLGEAVRITGAEAALPLFGLAREH